MGMFFDKRGGDKLASCGKMQRSCEFDRSARLWTARLYVEGELWRQVDLKDLGSKTDLERKLRDAVCALIWAVKHPNAAKKPEERLQLGRERAREVNFQELNSEECCTKSGCGAWFEAMRTRVGLPGADSCPEPFLEELAACEKALGDEAAPASIYPEPLRSNLLDIESAFGLTEDERDALAFLIVERVHEKLRGILQLFDFALGGTRLLAEILSIAFARTMSAGLFESDGNLMRSGLLEVCDPEADMICMRWSLMGDDGQSARLASDRLSPEFFFKGKISPAPRATLGLENYSHIPAVGNLLIPYLRSVLETRKPGVNILVYGPPGTGKTELARTAAEALDAKLYEIGALKEAAKNDNSRTPSRIARWSIAEKLYSASPMTLLVIDEAEDVINESASFFTAMLKRSNKAELNVLVETSPVPTFWLTNTISDMDPALIRRFDIVLEVPVPPETVRRRIAEAALGGIVSEGLIESIAKSENLSPAQIARTASVLKDLGERTPTALDEACETLIASSLKAQCLGRFPGKAEELPSLYDASFVNTTADLKAIAEGLKRRRAGRLCLYGPPGTGKTAYAKWLAREIGVPVLAKRASELLDMYVGGTEARIREAFEEASSAEAMLLIDEADSFLRDREWGERSWEISQVNELLTQMETYSGIFVATTNLIEDIDRAALRRFDLKAKFDYLKPAQRMSLLLRYLRALGIDPPDPEKIRSRMEDLDLLTPGDFAAAASGAAIYPVESSEAFIKRLEEDAALKRLGRSKPRIGF